LLPASSGGWLVGRIFGWLTFRIPADTKLAQTGDGLIAIAATFVSYGLTEIIECYGFLAVFVTALTLRHAHREHDFHREMHDVTEQVERLAMMILLLLFWWCIGDRPARAASLRRCRRGSSHPDRHKAAGAG
jgi:NhaP-type Na+/H+ or K+/H+ antiporter